MNCMQCASDRRGVYIYDSTVRTLRARYVIRTTVQGVYTSTCYRGGCLYYAAYTQLVLAQPRVPSNQCERLTYHYVYVYGTVHSSGL